MTTAWVILLLLHQPKRNRSRCAVRSLCVEQCVVVRRGGLAQLEWAVPAGECSLVLKRSTPHRAARFSITARTSAPNRPTSFFARIGPIPLTKPLLRYRSIPSAVVGGTVFMVVALNCSPCSLSLTHQPSATSHSPAVTEGNDDPTTVVSARCPFVFTRR